MKKHGFEANAADCWEKNGGGKFSFKDPLGTGKKTGGRSQRTSAKVCQLSLLLPSFVHLLTIIVGNRANDVEKESKHVLLQAQ